MGPLDAELIAPRGMKAQPKLQKNRLSSRRISTIGRQLVLTLYSYPELFGVADNNPYGLKVFAFLRLCGIPFEHRHIIEVSGAPRAQLPYIDDGGTQVGDSDEIIVYLIHKYGLSIDAGLTAVQQQTDVMLRRTLDDLYWVMSYSRWQDDQFWPSFRDAFLRAHPEITKASL